MGGGGGGWEWDCPTLLVLPHFEWIVTRADRWLVQVVRLPMAWAMTEFLPMPGCRVEQITPANPDFLHITARGIRRARSCCSTATPKIGWKPDVSAISNRSGDRFWMPS